MWYITAGTIMHSGIMVGILSLTFIPDFCSSLMNVQSGESMTRNNKAHARNRDRLPSVNLAKPRSSTYESPPRSSIQFREVAFCFVVT